MRKTKIICTIGPACRNEETLEAMVNAGMNVARLNFSHGTHAEHLETINMLKAVRERLNVPLAIMLDTKGPEYRIKSFENNSVFLNDGDSFTFTTDQIIGNEKKVSVSYAGLADELEIGDIILLNNALLKFEVISIEGHDINCRIVTGGELSNNKSMSFPGKTLKQSYVSEQDRADILFGIENDVDFIACSFVSRKQDMLDIKEILGDSVKKIDLIAKIENRAGIDNIDDICSECDGIMIARGDMGVEIPFVELPIIQKALITKCRLLGKRVITATEMLESMIHNPRPTRAETSDVANAVYDGTSAIMLSGETAAGQFPVDVVRTMDLIASTTEGNIDYKHEFASRKENENVSIDEGIAHAAVTTAHDLNAKAIIAVTKRGKTARLISKFRPAVQILGCTTDEDNQRKMNMSWGVTPFVIDEEDNTDTLFAKAVAAAKYHGYVKEGDLVVITAGVPLGISGMTNLMKVEKIK